MVPLSTFLKSQGQRMTSSALRASLLLLACSLLCGFVQAAFIRNLDDAKLAKIVNAQWLPNFGVEKAARLVVEKIEMLSKSETAGCHWIAKITTKDATNGESLVLAADFAAVRHNKVVQPNELFTTFSQEASAHGNYQHPDAELTNPKEKGKTESLTLLRLLNCTPPLHLAMSNGMCYIYVYRMLLFGQGLCECGDCVQGVKFRNNPLAEMKAVVVNDKLVKQTFKDQVAKEQPD